MANSNSKAPKDVIFTSLGTTHFQKTSNFEHCLSFKASWLTQKWKNAYIQEVESLLSIGTFFILQ